MNCEYENGCSNSSSKVVGGLYVCKEHVAWAKKMNSDIPASKLRIN